MKKILIIAGIIIVAIIILLMVGVSNLGPMIKTAVNSYGPEITQTDVRLSDVSVSIFTGEAKIKSLFLGNPKGFKSSEALKVGAVYVDVDEGTVTGNPIVINKIEVAAPEITYETKGTGDNFRTILRNVKKRAAAGKTSKKKTEGKSDSGKKLIINEVIIRDGQVNLAATALAGQGVSAILPEIRLKDVGKKKNGVTPEEAIEIILGAIYANIKSPAVTDTLNKGLKKLGPGLTSEDKKGIESATDTVKGLFKKKD
jgi:hypothetical protein